MNDREKALEDLEYLITAACDPSTFWGEGGTEEDLYECRNTIRKALSFEDAHKEDIKRAESKNE